MEAAPARRATRASVAPPTDGGPTVGRVRAACARLPDFPAPGRRFILLNRGPGAKSNQVTEGQTGNERTRPMKPEEPGWTCKPENCDDCWGKKECDGTNDRDRAKAQEQGRD